MPLGQSREWEVRSSQESGVGTSLVCIVDTRRASEYPLQ